MNAKIYHFDNSRQAYERAQTDGDINDGDVLIIESEKIVGLVGDFPLAVTESTGVLHALADGETFEKLGFSDKSIALARDAAKTLGFPLAFPTGDSLPLETVIKNGRQKAALETFAAVVQARDEAEIKAWDSLGRYKFEMFGYWASSWVKFNQVIPKAYRAKNNPFKEAVMLARSFK